MGKWETAYCYFLSAKLHWHKLNHLAVRLSDWHDWIDHEVPCWKSLPSKAVKWRKTTRERPQLFSSGVNSEDHLLCLPPNLSAPMGDQSGHPLWALFLLCSKDGARTVHPFWVFKLGAIFPIALVCWSVQSQRGMTREGLAAQCVKLWNSSPGDTIHPNPSSQLLRAHLVNEIIQYANWSLWK